jgi:ribosome-associated heat shock protein Hsp15
MSVNMSQDSKIRIDKWLWACRFYKTRAIAKAAIEGGKVHYQGQKPKPGKIIQIGELIKLRQGHDEKTVIIVELSDKRQSAPIAQSLYQETEESILKRQEISQMRKLSAPSTTGRPDKKQRRMIHRFKNVHDYKPDSE